MALKLLINISKKIPGPREYSSVQSSVSIEGELSAGQDPVVEAARLQAQAQQAVDQFLGIASVPRSTPQQASESPNTAPTRPTPSPQSYRVGGQRRPPAPCSPAQVRYLRQLIDQGGHDAVAFCNRFNVSTIEEIRSRDASSLIDELRATSAAGAHP